MLAEMRAAAKQVLVNTANETQAVLPDILKELPHIRADKSELLTLGTLPRLKKEDCPNYPKTVIKVTNQDSFNAAIMLVDTLRQPPPSHSTTAPIQAHRPAVLNCASDTSPGGGWLRGAMAQEEALCYRSSLGLSLHEEHYPLTPHQGFYTRDVVIIRTDNASGHALLTPNVPPAQLKVASVVSIAAIRRPQLVHNNNNSIGGHKLFARASDRELTKDKMRLVLRMAAAQGNDSLVLGALGCGVFRNPVEEIAGLWRELLVDDEEFQGGWWREVWFAILSEDDGGILGVFKRVLDGVEV